MEKAKAFFLICAGIFLLTVAVNISTLQAYAEGGERTGTIIDMESNNQGSYYFVTDTGELWIYRSPEGWWQEAEWPGGGVPVENSSWSQLKSNFGQ